MKASYRLTLRTPRTPPTPGLWTPSHSWVKQYMDQMRVHWGYEDNPNVRNTSGGYPTAARSHLNQHQSLIAPNGTDDYGLQVGSGAGGESPTDYKLTTQIDHGVGGGELQYGLTTVSAVTIDADDIYVDVSRTFTNGSGGIVTVRELGLVNLNSPEFYLIIRDKLADPTQVPHEGILTLTYRLQTTN